MSSTFNKISVNRYKCLTTSNTGYNPNHGSRLLWADCHSPENPVNRSGYLGPFLMARAKMLTLPFGR
jgi:hypothetical protein